MANHPGRAPRAPMIGAKADLKPLGRVIRMLFQDYPAMLIAVMACIIISAVVGILPAIYIETITSYIEDGLRLGWDGVSGRSSMRSSPWSASILRGLPARRSIRS